MGFLDVIRGRKAPARPHLDALFALPSAEPDVVLPMLENYAAIAHKFNV